MINNQLVGCVVDVDIFHVDSDLVIVTENGRKLLERNAVGFWEHKKYPDNANRHDAYKDLTKVSERGQDRAFNNVPNRASIQCSQTLLLSPEDK